MRIVFITGSLEAGKDGIGDYARRLGGALSACGIHAGLVAINDRWLSEGREADVVEEGTAMPALRLPAGMSWSRRMQWTKEWLRRFEPDCVSLQFVPFAYDPRGLPVAFAGRLARAVGGRPFHLMFHEMWVGGGAAVPLKRRILAQAQRWVFARLLRRLAPAFVTTQVGMYQSQLGALGVRAALLPLFGNIGAPEAADRSWADEQFAAQGIQRTGRTLVAGVFGTIHPEWDPGPMLGDLLKSAAATGREVVVVAFGNPGPSGQRLLPAWRLQWANQPRLVELGMLDSGRVAAVIERLDLGLAATPWALIGKSGTAAALLDFGAPVVVTRDDVAFPGKDPGQAHPLLAQFTPGRLFDWSALLGRRRGYDPRLPQIAQQFAELLRENVRLPAGAAAGRNSG